MSAYGLKKEHGGCQETSVISVISVISVTDAEPQPLPHPLWTPELTAEGDDPAQPEAFHEEREDLLPIDRDETDLLPLTWGPEEPDWFAELSWPPEDEELPEGYDEDYGGSWEA